GRPLEQPQPREQIVAFETALREEGVARGVVVMNGDELDFDIAKQQVLQSKQHFHRLASLINLARFHLEWHLIVLD
ncbi:MAG: hypothetical protein ACO3BC_03375, partial [Ilumatobacteraceae bacterium]